MTRMNLAAVDIAIETLKLLRQLKHLDHDQNKFVRGNVVIILMASNGSLLFILTKSCFEW